MRLFVLCVVGCVVLGASGTLFSKPHPPNTKNTKNKTKKGVAVGVKSEGETACCKFVVGDASYFPGKSKVSSRVVRAMCVLSHPIPDTDGAHSAQIILPQRQIGRRSGE